MSAISRAMAAPVEMAMPASASERAGESLTPSPTMITVCPFSFSCRINAALSSGSTSAYTASTPTSAATASAVRRLSPVIITTLVKPLSCSALTASRASRRRGSWMQITAASSPSMQRYRWEYAAGSASNFGCSPSGMRQPSSSKTKWALPMMTFLPSTMLEMPWATTYCTCEWYSSWVSPCRFASATTAFAMECG